MSCHSSLLAILVFAAACPAADLAKVDRTIGKEPEHRGQPKYGLLVFGPEAKDRVWLVHDGDTLYVDRNGNGALTDEGEKIAAKVDKNLDPKEYGYFFEVGDVRVGGRVHKDLRVSFPPLSRYAADPSFAPFKPLHDALKADPKALGTMVRVEVDSGRLKGGGAGGRLEMSAGFFDANGVLRLADKPGDAPVIQFDGPLQVTFYGWTPSLRLARDNDLILMVGTPGFGPGTFAMLAYEDAIPDAARPKVEFAWPAAKAGAPPVKQFFELKERC